MNILNSKWTWIILAIFGGIMLFMFAPQIMAAFKSAGGAAVNAAATTTGNGAITPR